MVLKIKNERTGQIESDHRIFLKLEIHIFNKGLFENAIMGGAILFCSKTIDHEIHLVLNII